jgi:acetylornithine deacetylase/succinyl-diaminopimelate desuccinylase-like protein
VICYAYPNDPERPIMVAFYTLPGEGREEMCAMLEAALAARLGGRLDRYGLHYREPWFEPAFTPPETSLVRHLTEAARAALCREPRINTISKQDSFVLTNHAGIPTVSWGGTMKTIGRGAYHHPDENMPVDEAWAATRTACDAVRRWLEEE